MASGNAPVQAIWDTGKDVKFGCTPPLSQTCDPEGDIRPTAPSRTMSFQKEVCFIVSLKAMRLACDAWNRMLAPDSPFLEAKEMGHGKLSFPEDYAAPLETLLHIAHLNFDKIPRYISFQQLLDLAVLTDKYGATKLVRPWIKTWIANKQHLLLQPGHEEWLWIAWERTNHVQVITLESVEMIVGPERVLPRKVLMYKKGDSDTAELLNEGCPEVKWTLVEKHRPS